MTPQILLEKILAEPGRCRPLRCLYTNMKQCVLSGDVESCDEMFRGVPIERMRPYWVLGILVVTTPTRQQSAARADFVIRAREHFQKQGLDSERIRGLLGGLE